jgi:exopolysaccharide production protein ExoQ
MDPTFGIRRRPLFAAPAKAAPGLRRILARRHGEDGSRPRTAARQGRAFRGSPGRQKVPVSRALDKNVLLSLLCLSLGPLVYAAWLGTVAAMLALASVALIASRRDGLPALAGGMRAFAAFLPLLAWMFASAGWSLDGGASIDLALRLAGLFAAGAVLVASLGRLPLEQLRLPLTASALGFSGAALLVVIDLALGGHLAQFLHAPRLDGYDPALAYGRGATLHAILLVPVAVGLLQIARPRLAAGYALSGVIAILETSSLSAKTALFAGLATLAAVSVMPRLRWAGLAFFAVAAVILPLMFPLPLNPAASCWLADHKPSALHRLEIWSFVAEHVGERPVVGWGLDASRRLPGGTAQVVIRACDAAGRPDGIALSSEILPLHPHNGILQVWLELGGIGAALGFAPLFFAIWRAFRNPQWRTRTAQATIAGTIAAAASVGLVSFGIWEEWFLSGLFIAAAMVVLTARQAAAAARAETHSKPGARRA